MLSRTFLLFASATGLAVAICPSGYDAWDDGECYSIFTTEVVSFAAAKQMCEGDEANLPSIHQEKQAYHLYDLFILTSTRSKSFWLGAWCNVSDQVLHWSDGSSFDYETGKLVDCRFSGPTAYVMAGPNVWMPYPLDGSKSSVICHKKKDPEPPVDCEDYDRYDDNTCYKYFFNTLTWKDAEKICAGELGSIISIHDMAMNDFVRRTAIANHDYEGPHLGLELNALAPPLNLSWSDGTRLDFQNFAPGGATPCPQLATPTGKWVNDGCEAYRSFMCARKPFRMIDHGLTGDCPTMNSFGAGQDVFSPSYPAALRNAIACDYNIAVDVGKRVEVEIVNLEINACCNTVDVFDGANKIANWTGTAEPGTRIRSSGSNLRLRYTTEAGGSWNTRGWHLKVHAV